MKKDWFANTTPPDPSEMPSRRRLIIATLLLPVFAVVIIVAIVLPAERGIDPTGLGEVTGLTEMGFFKVEADSQFAAMEAVAAQNAADSAAVANPTAPAPR